MTKKERQEEARQQFQKRISALQKKGFTIYRIAKGGYDGEHWGYKHKDVREGGGFDYQFQVVEHLEKLTNE